MSFFVALSDVLPMVDLFDKAKSQGRHRRRSALMSAQWLLAARSAAEFGRLLPHMNGDCVSISSSTQRKISRSQSTPLRSRSTTAADTSARGTQLAQALALQPAARRRSRSTRWAGARTVKDVEIQRKAWDGVARAHVAFVCARVSGGTGP